MKEHEAIHIPLKDIKVGDRLRKDYGDVEDLAESIRREGIIHPVTINHQKELVAGGRRMAAMTLLGWDKVPVFFIETASETHLRRLEVEENVRRKAMTWQERCLGVYVVHKANLTEHEEWSMKQTGEMLGVTAASISNTRVVAQALEATPKDEEIWSCESATEALKLLLRRREEEATAMLASRGRTTKEKKKKPSKVIGQVDIENFREDSQDEAITEVGLGGMFGVGDPNADYEGFDDSSEVDEEEEVDLIDLNKFLFQGDSLEHMAQMPDEYVNGIISDLPYAIDMDNLAQTNNKMRIETTAKEHGVEDNLAFLRLLIPEMYRILKPASFAVIWMDQTHYEKIYEWATEAGFKVQRWAMIWSKTHPCKNQAAQYNFTKNYETAYLLRKGSATLREPQSTSIWAGTFDQEDKIFDHPFAKPIKLWKWLMRATLTPGDTFYDPCAGCGSSVFAGISAGFHPIASELKVEHFNQMILNTKTAYSNVLEKVDFKYEPIH